MVASYPRSGNTWLRFLLASTLADRAAGFDDISAVVPEIGLHGSALPLLPSGGRLIKTHEPWRKEYSKAIYLVRDIRDVMISYYDRGKHLGVFSDLGFDQFVPQFLEGQTNTSGSWSAHVRSWLDSRLAPDKNLLLIRFEDMRTDTEDTLTKILDFLGVSGNPEKVREAIEANSLEEMKAKENASRMLPKMSDNEGRFVRKGEIAGWRARLTRDQAELVLRYAASELERLGYPSRPEVNVP
jgi:hypothetical protein